MSEEILKALMQLFAIIAKQDAGVSINERDYVSTFLKQQLNESSVKEYLALFDSFVGSSKEKKSENEEETEKKDKPRLTSVKDSVKTLGIAKKINKTLTQKQKVVVLVRLFELINADQKFTAQRMAIIDTAAEVFNISKEEYTSIHTFVVNNNPDQLLECPDILIVSKDNQEQANPNRFIESLQLDGSIFILRVPSVDLYFTRYTGLDEIVLNGLPINGKRIYLFANGSVIKQPKGKPIFYTDVAGKFLSDGSTINVIFHANNVQLKFPNGHIGLRNINVQETSGKLVAIMGGSGAGKTTLLNVLSGIDSPSSGEVLINGINLHQNPDKTKGIIGYIPQDDLLIEELSVFENLFYATKLVYRDMAEGEIIEKVHKVLTSLGLYHIKDLKVGNPLNKKISGGQRKRLNIGLELIREPAVMFVDEPTSGLSSRDSENVMELLRELTVKGKLIFVVIHQPSSDIYKMFDSVIILDEGGYQIYYGNPVEAVIYFKQLDNQINSSVGECPTCGNVNPETIFSIIESRIVDEYGKSTGNRKVAAEEWNEHFTEKIKPADKIKDFDKLPETLKNPTWFKQFKIFFARDLFAKLSNTQYLVINLLEAPVLGFLLAFVIRYIDDPNSKIYIFRENENLMPYLFMGTIVALFLGLIVSAEEIYKDRKILKREAFLNLSRSSYLFSKIGILFILSAIQAFLFVLVGNAIFGVRGMYLEYWMIFFSLCAFANVLGLNISSAFNSAVTIYILIPFLIIPQMVLTGAMFSFDKINRNLGGGSEKVPVLAEIMPSRWAFEALIVHQFVNNKYQKQYYDYNKLESACNYKNVYYFPELKRVIDSYRFNKLGDPSHKMPQNDIELLYNEIYREQQSEFTKMHQIRFEPIDSLKAGHFSDRIAEEAYLFFNQMQEFYRDKFNYINEIIDRDVSERISTPEGKESYQKEYDNYYNDFLGRFAKNAMAPLPVVRLDNRLVQKIDPVFLDPQDPDKLSFRTHFMAPRKNFFGMKIDTFYFNMLMLWIFTILMYVALYYQLLKKFLDSSGVLGPYFQRLFRKMRQRIIGKALKRTGL